MANLEPLIKYRKHGVDEKRRFLAQLYREAEQIERQKQAVANQMEREIELAKEMGSTDAQAFLNKYLEGARRKIQALDVSLKKMDARIAAAQEDMRAVFAEMKKVEIIQHNREARAVAAQKKKDDQELDEVAIDQYQRKLKEDD